jgi:hypothetical protein
MTDLGNIAQQLSFKNEFAFLVFFTRLKCFIIFPSYCLVALSACDVSDDMTAGRHIPFAGITGCDVYDVVEEVGFAMLTAEVLRYES